MVVNGLHIVSLRSDELGGLSGVAQRFGLDFDDAYQYRAAELYGLELISFDKDFDRTERGRKEPEDVVR